MCVQRKEKAIMKGGCSNMILMLLCISVYYNINTHIHLHAYLHTHKVNNIAMLPHAL